MSTTDESLEFWLDGFSSGPLTERELDNIERQPKSASDTEIKRLVQEVKLLRRLLQQLLTYTETLELQAKPELSDKDSDNLLLKRIRFIVDTRTEAE